MVFKSNATYKIEHVGSKSVLGLSDLNPKSIIAMKDNNLPGQKWHLVAAGNYWFIRNALVSRYLEHDDPIGKFGLGVPVATVDHPHLVWEIKAAGNQAEVGEEVYRICHADWSMDIIISERSGTTSAPVLLYGVSNGNYQFWRFVESE